MILQKYPLSRFEIERLGNEEVLRLRADAIQIAAKFFERDSFMRRVLVDQDQSVRRGTNNITAENLPDHSQGRKVARPMAFRVSRGRNGRFFMMRYLATPRFRLLCIARRPPGAW